MHELARDLAEARLQLHELNRKGAGTRYACDTTRPQSDYHAILKGTDPCCLDTERSRADGIRSLNAHGATATEQDNTCLFDGKRARQASRAIRWVP